MKAQGDISYTTEPFYLGIEGEEWRPKLPGLVIPTGGTTKKGNPVSIAVIREDGGYVVISLTKWEHTDNALMAASIVRAIIEEARGNGIP